MKNRVILRRMVKGIALPLACFIPGAVVWVWLWHGIFQRLGIASKLTPLPLGIWFVLLVGLGFYNVQSHFNLGLQIGVSRRHLFQSLMAVWVLCIVVTASIQGIWSWLTPAPRLFVQELGYQGAATAAVQIANAVLVILSLAIAALVGIALKLATLTVAPDYRWWIGLACLVVIWWLAASQYSAQATRYLAQFVWLWPALLSLVGVALLIYIWHQFQVLEPTT